TYCHELGLVALVKGNEAVYLVSVDHRPASSLRRVHFIVAVPGPFDTRLAIPGAITIVDLAADVTKLKVAHAIRPELKIALDLGIHEVLRPHLHRRNPPAALER